MYMYLHAGEGCRLEFVLDSLEWPAMRFQPLVAARAPERFGSWGEWFLGALRWVTSINIKTQRVAVSTLEGSRAGDAEISSPVVFPGQLHFPERNKKPQLLVFVVGPLKAVARGVATHFYRIPITQTDTYGNFPSVFYALKSIKN